MRVPILLFAVALSIRLGAIFYWQFDGLYGQDPYAYLQQGQAIAVNLPQGQLPPLDFFWPNGFPALIALSSLFLGTNALAAQLTVLFCGSLIAPLAYLLTKELWAAAANHQAGVLAGLIVAVAGQPILSSIVVMADIPALFWASLAAWCLVRALNIAPRQLRFTLLYFLAAGGCFALAIITRWLYILLVPAFTLYTLFKLRQNGQHWWPTLLAIMSGLTILGPQLWLTLNKPEGLLHSWLLGWRPANFFLRQFETIDGYASYQLPVGIFYAQPAGHPAYIFPLLGLATLWGTWRLWRTRQWAPLILLLGWAMPVYLFLGGIPFQNFRFGLTLYLPPVILTGIGVSEVLNTIKQQGNTIELSEKSHGFTKALQPYILTITNALIAFSVVGMLGWSYPMLNSFITSHNQSKLIVRQVEQNLPDDATLLTFGLTLTFQHYTQLNTLEFFYFDQSSLEMLTESQSQIYLLLALHNIDSQWQGKTPQRNYHWLKENTTLIEMASFAPYTLFKIVGRKQSHLSIGNKSAGEGVTSLQARKFANYWFRTGSEACTGRKYNFPFSDLFRACSLESIFG